MGRAFITDVHRHPASFKSLRAFHRKFKEACVIQVGDEPIFSALDFDRVQATLLHSGKSSIPPVTLAPKRHVAFDPNSTHNKVLRPRDLHHITALLSLPGEDMHSSANSDAVATFADAMDFVDGNDSIELHKSSLQPRPLPVKQPPICVSPSPYNPSLCLVRCLAAYLPSIVKRRACTAPLPCPCSRTQSHFIAVR
jgi:hypothetical protein